MSLIPSQLGAEPKKLAVLGGLAVVLIVVYFINRTPDVPQQAASDHNACGAESAAAGIAGHPDRARCGNRHAPARAGRHCHAARRSGHPGFQAHSQTARRR